MYDDLDLVPVEEELVGVMSGEFKSCERSTAAFERDKRWRQPGKKNKEWFERDRKSQYADKLLRPELFFFYTFLLIQRGQLSL